MKENKGKLSIVFENVNSISEAVEKFSHFK
jgi:hypothetical protein